MWIDRVLGARRDFDGPVAGFAAEVNPEVVKFTDSGVRKLMLRIDGRVSLEVVVPDARAFLDEVWACAKWVEHGDPPGRDLAAAAAYREWESKREWERER